jgi:hypothetical protein
MVKEILRAQYDRSGRWKIVKKTSVGSGGWRRFGGKWYVRKEEADAAIDRLIER